MTWLLRGGISRLSELEIDAHKGWQAFGISNIKELALAMTRGDILARGDSVLQKIQPGPSGYVLTSAGPLHLPVWAPPGSVLNRYFPVEMIAIEQSVIYLPDRAVAISAPIVSPHDETIVPTKLPVLDLTKLVAIYTADAERAETGNIDRFLSVYLRVAGAVADDGGVQTDETAAANNDTANDMTLVPALPVVGDAYYWLLAQKFGLIRLNVGTAGDWVGALTFEYFNGAAYAALAGVVDGTNGFRNAGINNITFTIPGDMAQDIVGGLGPYYPVRARVSDFTSINIQPKGTRAWLGKAI